MYCLADLLHWLDGDDGVAVHAARLTSLDLLGLLCDGTSGAAHDLCNVPAHVARDVELRAQFCTCDDVVGTSTPEVKAACGPLVFSKVLSVAADLYTRAHEGCETDLTIAETAAQTDTPFLANVSHDDLKLGERYNPWV